MTTVPLCSCTDLGGVVYVDDDGRCTYCGLPFDPERTPL